MRDYADEQVKGLTRFLPTPMSRLITLSLLPVAWTVGSVLLANPSLLNVENGTELHVTKAFLGAAVSVLLLLVVLVIDLGVELHHSKHSRIRHYSNEHPLMNWRFLFQNAKFSHWLMLFLLAALCFGLGFATALAV